MFRYGRMRSTRRTITRLTRAAVASGDRGVLPSRINMFTAHETVLLQSLTSHPVIMPQSGADTNDDGARRAPSQNPFILVSPSFLTYLYLPAQLIS